MRIGSLRAAKLRTIGWTGAILGVAATTAMWALPAGANTDSFGAYWVTTPTGGLVSDSATFVVPSLNCAGNTGQLGQEFGVIDNTQTVESVVRMECNAATPSYNFIVTAGTSSFTENGVSAGDTVVTSYFQTATQAQATVHDLTSGFTWVADGTPPGFNDSAVIGEFPVFPSGGGGQLHIAPFGTTTFSKCQVNGDYLGYGNSLQQFSLKEGSTPGLAIATGAIVGKDAFKLFFKHS
jgi:hypothetical protein